MFRKKISFQKILLGISLFLIIIPIPVYGAGKKETSIRLNNGLNNILYETSQLKEAKIEQYKILEKDLEEFSNKGSSKINSTNIFYVLRENNFDAKDYDAGLAGTNLEGLGKDFKAAEEEYGVNGILLMAMAKHETGNGTSELFLNKNNLFGFNAYDYDPYNQASDFKTPADSINTVAKHLKENYLDPDGDYYKGMSTDGIGSSYATDPDWSKKVDWMMVEVGQNMLDNFNQEAAR